MVEWLGSVRLPAFLLLFRVRGEKVTNGGLDCALFGFLVIEPIKNVLIGVAVGLDF